MKYPGLRRRQNAFYYDTGGKPRRWIALGSDEAAAMKRYAELRAEKNAVKPESEPEPQRPPVIEAYDPAAAIRIYGKGPWSDQGISARKWSEDNWESLYVPAVELWARRTPRNWVRTIESGIYFLYADDGELLYIGLSTAIGNRIASHIRERRIPFTHVSWVAVPELILPRIESAYIWNLMPPWNAHYSLRCLE